MDSFFKVAPDPQNLNKGTRNGPDFPKTRVFTMTHQCPDMVR